MKVQFYMQHPLLPAVVTSVGDSVVVVLAAVVVAVVIVSVVAVNVVCVAL